jgi:hypothetical protein
MTGGLDKRQGIGESSLDLMIEARFDDLYARVLWHDFAGLKEQQLAYGLLWNNWSRIAETRISGERIDGGHDGSMSE